MAVPVTLSYVDFEGKSHLAPGATAAQKGFLDIIDQTLLPGEQKRLLLETPEAVYEAIKQLRVRGGTRYRLFCCHRTGCLCPAF